jgi:hypothetical protein
MSHERNMAAILYFANVIVVGEPRILPFDFFRISFLLLPRKLRFAALKDFIAYY